jgi:1-deoxy-D-xylulose-5-phosphate synthase
VLQYIANEGLLRPGLEIRTMMLPDIFQDHDDPAKQYAAAGLDVDGIVALVSARFAKKSRKQA